eukprot:RCo041928
MLSTLTFGPAPTPSRASRGGGGDGASATGELPAKLRRVVVSSTGAGPGHLSSPQPPLPLPLPSTLPLRAVFISPYTPASGNRTTASRLTGILRALGHEVTLVQPQKQSQAEMVAVVAEAGICVALHAWRSGVMLLGCAELFRSVPLVVIFGGTDVNEMYHEPDRLEVMTTVVNLARALVCFSPAVKTAAEALWPTMRAKMAIIPQSVQQPCAGCATCQRPSPLEEHVAVALPLDPPLSRPEVLEDTGRSALCARPVPAPQDKAAGVQPLLPTPTTFPPHSSSSSPSAMPWSWPSSSPHPCPELLRRLPANAALFVLPAALREVKGVGFLLPAMAAWHRTCPEVFLALVGNPADPVVTAEVKKFSSCPMETGILSVPAMEQACLHALMCSPRCVAVVNSSVSEGQPQAILEGMALGTPVMVRGVPGNLAVVQHRVTGLVFNTPEEFISEARELIQSRGLGESLSAAARQYVGQHHRWEGERVAYHRLLLAVLPPLRRPGAVEAVA